MGFKAFMQSLLNGSIELSREHAIRDEVNGIIIDTCYTFDNGKWETAIMKNDDDIKVVEQYTDEEKARIGHNKWLKMITENPNMELKECQTLDQMIEWTFS